MSGAQMILWLVRYRSACATIAFARPHKGHAAKWRRDRDTALANAIGWASRD